jgi:vacuolar-type H+-ATPase subunit I/STV1
MVRVPAWVWLAVALAAVLAVGVQQGMRAAYHRGIANDTAQRVTTQESVIDSLAETSTQLEEELKAATAAADQQRRATESEFVRLGQERIAARERSLALTERLGASLDSVQALDLDSIVIGYEVQIAALDSMVVVEREYRVAETLRASAASELAVGFRLIIAEHEALDLMQGAEIRALRASMQTSIGLRIKADWWLGAAGVAVGYLLWGTR